MARKPKTRTFGTIEPRYNAREWREWKEGRRKTKPRPTGYRARYRLRPLDTPAGVIGELVSAPHSFSTKDAAEAWLDSERRRVDSGDMRTPQQVAADNADAEAAAEAAAAERAKTERWTVQQWGEHWLADRERSGTAMGTLRVYRSRLEQHVYPAFGHVRLVDLTENAIGDWYYSLDRPGVRVNAYRTLRTMMNDAVASTRTALEKNPCRVRNGDSRRGAVERYEFTPEQVQAIADSIDPRGRALIVLLADAGLRVNEALALQVGDIAVEDARAVVNVRHSMVRTPDGSRKRGDTKTKKSRRVVIMPATVEALRTHIAQYCAPGPGAPLFTIKPGKGPLSDRTAATWMRKAMKKAGIVVPEGKLGGLHALRHYAATRFAASGASLAAIMQRFGWTKPPQAVHYQHPDEEYQAAMLDRMAQAAGSATWESRAASAAGVASLVERRNSRHNNDGEGDRRGAVEA